MEQDDLVCICYSVSLRKLVNFARRVRPVQNARMSECLGAGTGCGWCIPLLCELAQRARANALPADYQPALTPEDYNALRAEYRRLGRARNRFSPAPPSEPESPGLCP